MSLKFTGNNVVSPPGRDLEKFKKMVEDSKKEKADDKEEPTVIRFIRSMKNFIEDSRRY